MNCEQRHGDAETRRHGDKLAFHLRVSASPRRRVSSARRGFSFTEILFAIMILGIGFIMVAAMFPVAIKQTENSQQETIGAAVARGAVDYVQQFAKQTYLDSQDKSPSGHPLCLLRPTVPFPPHLRNNYNLWTACTGTNDDPTHNPALPALLTELGTQITPLLSPPLPKVINGEVWQLDVDNSNSLAQGIPAVDQAMALNNQSLAPLTFPQNEVGRLLWSIATQNMVQTSDPRFAWVAFYKRDLILSGTTLAPIVSYAPYAQVIVVALQATNTQTYPSMLDKNNLPLDLTEQTPEISIRPTYSTQGACTIHPPDATHLNYWVDFAQDATQAIRAADGAFVIVSDDQRGGSLNGHVYRLGIYDQTLFSGEFAPGYGPPPADQRIINFAGTLPVMAFIVGKAQDPSNPGTFTGRAQDIAVYSTFISCPSN